MNNSNPLIEVKNLKKFYREGTKERIVLDGINVTINRGEIIVILGKSGSGKSTFLNLLSGIDIPCHGEVIIDNINLTTLSEHKRTLFRRKHIGFIFQFFNLIPTLTVEENLFLPLELNGICTGNEKKRVIEHLEIAGLADRLKSFPDELSGGEQQRIAIVRAISHNPTLILADEPTGNLDLDTGRQILNLLDSLIKKSQKTMIMVTHSKEVIGMASRVFTIKDSCLIESQ